jgi:hypothetical protein
LKNTAESLPDYGRRYRAGERISTAFVESAVNQIIDSHVEIAANALVAAECTPSASGANPRHRRPSSPGLRTVVPRLYRQRRNPPTQRLTPPNRTLSFTLLEYLQFGERHTSPNGRSPFISPN